MGEEPMPVFTIKAKDALAVPAVRAYKAECEAHGLWDQAFQVERAITEIRKWQTRNVDATKLPDHEHVPSSPEEQNF